MTLSLYCPDKIDRHELATVPVPTPTRSWQPIAHTTLLRTVDEVLPHYGLSVVEEAHGLSHGGQRYFGMMRVANDTSEPEFTRVIGLRNSHDQRLTAGLVCGMQVMVCSNLAFTGEVQFGRKHTSFILHHLPDLVEDAIARLVASWDRHSIRIDRYKARRLNDRAAHDLTVQALDTGAILARDIPHVLHEYRKPSHPQAFRARNVWSWQNACTEVLKRAPLPLLASRTQHLTKLCDEYVGLN